MDHTITHVTLRLNTWNVCSLQLNAHQGDWIWGAETQFHWKLAL